MCHDKLNRCDGSFFMEEQTRTFFFPKAGGGNFVAVEERSTCSSSDGSEVLLVSDKVTDSAETSAKDTTEILAESCVKEWIYCNVGISKHIKC